MDLTIVIVNWNTRDLLRGCLASLPAACGPLAWEVIVVDNDSADGSVAMLRAEFPDVRVIEAGGNLGFSRGNNLAFPAAQGRYVLLLNPDTVCGRGALATLLAFAEARPRVGAVGPLLTGADGEPTITYGYFPSPRHHWLGFIDPLRRLPFAWARRRVVHVPDRTEPSSVVDYIAGACFLMPREALAEVGPLDERFFMYFEETDWCLRARACGRQVWYCAEAEVVHLEGRAAELVSRFSIVQFQRSYRLFVAKHHAAARLGEFRAAQFLEYAGKALYRWLHPRDRQRNRALARQYRLRARLQLQARIDATPPRGRG